MRETTKISWWQRPELRLIALFVLLSGLLYFISDIFRSAIDRNGNLAAAAGRMRIDLVSTFRAIADLRSIDPEVANAAPDELARVASTVDRHLTTLLEGGEFSPAPGQTISIAPDALPRTVRNMAESLRAGWAPLSAAVARVAADPFDPEAKQSLFEIARTSEANLLRYASAMIGMIGADSLVHVGRLRITLIVAAVLGVSFFLLLIYLYSRQLAAVAAARKETDEILATVNSGLFLLDRNFRIGQQYSAALAKILPYTEIAGRNFLELVKPLVDSKTLNTLKDYLGLLFEPRVKESLVGTLNPLDRVQINLTDEEGRSERRYVEFAFRRVAELGAPTYLLVSANDVTERVEMRAELDRLRDALNQESERAIELVAQLSRLEPRLARATVTRWDQLLREANEALRKADVQQGSLSGLIDQVFRPLHTMKGEAVGIGLNHFALRIGAIERELADLRTRSELDGNDFLPITVGLEDLFRQHASLATIVENLFADQSDSARQPKATVDGSHSGADVENLVILDRLVTEVGRELGRTAVLEKIGFDEGLPKPFERPLLDLSVQLVRNALAHGIEDPDERARCGKPRAGKLRLEWRRMPNGSYELRFEDDGAGIDFDAVRKRAVATGRLTSEAAAAARDSDLLRLLFEPGFTTREVTSTGAGFGVGLDIVREIASRLRARIGVSTSKGRGTCFRFSIPAEAVQ